MHDSIVIGLIHNTAILLAFSLIYDYSWVKDEDNKKTSNKLLTGAIIGAFGIILMMTPWTLIPGIVFDTRSILLSISGLFFGMIPTLVAMAITAAYRITIGGEGVWMGLGVIVSSGTIGILWKMARPFWKKNYVLELFVMGILVHSVMLCCAFLLPSRNILETIENIAIPLITIYSPGTMLLGLLMVKQFNNWQNRKAKDSLLESERRFTEMLKNVNLLSVILDNKGNVTFCNEFLIEISGYKDNEILGSNWFERFIPDENREKLTQFYNRLICGEVFFPHLENEIISKNGVKHLISWNNTLMRNTEGEIIGVASIGENITARRAAEDQKLQFGNILEASLNEIYVFDAETLHYKYANFGALNNLGYSSEKIKTLTPMDIQPDYKPSSFRRLLIPLTNHEKKIIQYETRNRRIDGTYYPVEIHMQLFEYSDEHILLAVIQDITERKQWEYQLIEARRKAEENDRLKSIFLSNMSHEIRTPMNSIIGFSDLLNNPELDNTKRALFVDIIKSSSNRLLGIINDILDISKLEARQLSLSLEDCPIADIFVKSGEAFKKSELLIDKPNVEFQLDIPVKYNDLSIVIDKNRFQQVLDNLITNAIKYTKKGLVEAGFKLAKQNGTQFLEVFVADTGIGIPAEMHEMVFERFRQVEEHGYHAGAGLGLSISKGLVNLWGGRIWFSSKENKGTTFYFTVPLTIHKSVINQKAKSEENIVAFANKSIIIAEDDYNSYMYLRELLDGHTLEISYAENGQILMDMLEKTVPDLLILDMNMPVKSGYTCLQEMRKKNMNLRIIVQTAYAMAEEKEKCLQMGCQGYLSKPVKRADLYKLINQIMEDSL